MRDSWLADEMPEREVCTYHSTWTGYRPIWAALAPPGLTCFVQVPRINELETWLEAIIEG